MLSRLHLITLPWLAPQHGPVAVACLKAYIKQTVGGEADVRCHSPNLSIPFALGDGNAAQFFLDYHEYGESPYLLLYARRFGLPGITLRELGPICRRLSAAQPALRPLTRSILGRLDNETRRFVHEELGPQLDPGALNVVGFSITFDQVYASLYCAQLLQRKYPKRRVLFLFGGNSAASPPVATLFRKVDMRGFLIIGEGEKKLELIQRAVLDLPEHADDEQIEEAVRHTSEGIVHTFDDVNLHEREEKFFATQFASMDALPRPDYDDYFATVRRLVGSDGNFAIARQSVAMMAEGSRGCFVRCDFCGLNAAWMGFRRRPPERIVADLLAQIERYQATNIMFVDNVCDTWAEKFADALIERGLRFPFFMEMRADHPERFWTKLSLAGMQSAQIGIESIAAPLLGKMAKGVAVVRNLATQKYLLELGIISLSNLIINHPRGTVDDIVQTRRILEWVPHFRLFDLSRFHLDAASPLYEGLRPDERLTLRPMVPSALPSRLRAYAVANGYELPPALQYPPDVARAWKDFAEWHAAYSTNPDVRDAFVRVMRLSPQKLIVRDFRDGNFSETLIEGDLAMVYDACHRGVTPQEIVDETRLDPALVTAAIDDLVGRRLLLPIDGYYLSIALRSRDELVERARTGRRTAAIPQADFVAQSIHHREEPVHGQG